MNVGVHVIAEFYGCNPNVLNDLKFINTVLKKTVSGAGFNQISSKLHQFNPHGVTGFILLSESHISIHTWPELEYAAIDVFSCGAKKKAIKALEILKKELKPKSVKKVIIHRGLKK